MNIDYELLEQQLGIVTQEQTDALLTIPADQLFSHEGMRPFLEEYQKLIKGLDIQVAGTYFAASWRVVCAALQYMLSLECGGGVHFLPRNLTIQIKEVLNYPRTFFVLKDLENLTWSEEGERTALRESVIRTFYQDGLRPIMETIASVTKLPLTQVWGQIPLGLSYYVELISAKLEDDLQRSRMREDYEFLTKELPADCFGLKRSPFDIKEIWVDSPHRPGEKTRMKPTCCLAYRTDTGHGYCYTCPKLSKEEREAKRLEIMEKAAVKHAK